MAKEAAAHCADRHALHKKESRQSDNGCGALATKQQDRGSKAAHDNGKNAKAQTHGNLRGSSLGVSAGQETAQMLRRSRVCNVQHASAATICTCTSDEGIIVDSSFARRE